MKYIKYFIPILVLFLSIGYAATNIALNIDGDAAIASDIEDFKVYISSIKLNGQDDISLLKGELEFKLNIIDAENTEYVIDYEVTNASTKFDAILDIKCDYVADDGIVDEVKNSFDIEEPLIARSSKSGSYTISIKEDARVEEINRSLICKINPSALERTEIAEGDVPEALVPRKILYIDVDEDGFVDLGDEVFIGNEKFNILVANEEMVMVLGQYNLNNDYRQSTECNPVVFADGFGWEYMPGPKEIDINVWSNTIKKYIDEYILYLQEESTAPLLKGDLVSLDMLKQIGCRINDDYSYTAGLSCLDDDSWLINGQSWWTKSANSTKDDEIWLVNDNGELLVSSVKDSSLGIRPVVLIPYEFFVKLSLTSNSLIDDLNTDGV